MSQDPRDRRLSASDIEQLAAASDAVRADCGCTALRCDGWETLPPDFDESRLARVGAVAAVPVPPDGEPTWREHHPAGTRYWSADAPIALGHFPYNRSEAWRCVDCGRAYLRYVEAGGYFVDRRIRALRGALVTRTDPADDPA